MSTCPNFNDEKYKYLESALGELEAYKYWRNNNGDLSDINPEGGSVVPTSNPAVINASLKLVLGLKSNKIQSMFDRFFKSNPRKFFSELMSYAPKNEVDLLQEWAEVNKPKDINDMITGVLADMSYTIELNTAKERSNNPLREREIETGVNNYGLSLDAYIDTVIDRGYTTDQVIDSITRNYPTADNEYLYFNFPEFQPEFQGEEGPTRITTPQEVYDEIARRLDEDERKPSQYYSNMTVPGGVNYTENEIATPGIKPSIKGHAAFSTENGIGWFRSDDEIDMNRVKERRDEDFFTPDKELYKSSKTRRILEVQSDLFQKGREKEDLVGVDVNKKIESEYGADYVNQITPEYREKYNKTDTKENQFLQILNKDNNWATVFVKSIVQDSARKGYEKVLFPSGDTASKVEGHTTLEGFKKLKEDRLRELEIKDGKYRLFAIDNSGYSGEYDTYEEAQKQSEKNPFVKNNPDKFTIKKTDNSIEINQLKEELKNINELGFTKLTPIHNFYQNTVKNILVKQYGKDNIKDIKDEYGNKWFELALKPKQANEVFYFKRDDSFKPIPNSISPDGNPMIDEQREYEASQMRDAFEKPSSIQTFSVGGNTIAIKVDPKVVGIVSQLDPDDRRVYNNFLYDNLYTRKDNPTTTELLNNAALMAKDLGRSDLVDVTRLVYKYLYKNPTLSVRVIEKMDQDIPDAFAYYGAVSNRITFARDKIGMAPIEGEVGTVVEEFLHALTVQPFLKAQDNVQLSPEEKAFKDTVEAYYNYYKSRMGANKSDYRFSSAQEFLVGALTVNSFKEHLSSIKLNGEKPSNLFVEFFKDLFKRFMGLFGIKFEQKVLDKTNYQDFEQGLYKTTAEYLSKMNKVGLYDGLREEGRDYGLSFAVTAAQDWASEKNQMRSKFTDEDKVNLRKFIDKSINSIKSFGSSIRNRLTESSEAFQAIFRELKKLEETPGRVDQVDFFVDFTSEIAALINIAHTNILKLANDTKLDDPDFKLKEYDKIMSAIRNFDPILSDINRVKIKLSGLGIVGIVKDLDDMMIKRRNIEGVYSDGILPLVTGKITALVDEPSKRAIEQATQSLNKLKENLKKAGPDTSRGRRIQKEIKNREEKIVKEYSFDEDKVISWLNGEMGDSNVFSTWLMAGISSSDPIVSSLQKFIRDNVGKVAPRINELNNSLQSAVDEYVKATSRSVNDINKFNAPMIQTYKIIKTKEDGTSEEDDEYALLHEFNGNHIIKLQTFAREIGKLSEERRAIEGSQEPDEERLKTVLDNIRSKTEERRTFMNDYMELPYKKEVHDAKDMLYMDIDGQGYSAWDYMGPLINTIDDLEKSIDESDDEAHIGELWKQLDESKFELARLSSLYSKQPGTREYRVAEVLKERAKKLKEYSDFILTKKGEQHFNAEKARKERQLAKGEITPQKYERWLEENTVTELSKAYWDKKTDILGKLSAIMSEMKLKTGDKNEEVSKLYKDIEDVVKAHRDSDGIINGQEMTEQELADVKSIEVKVEKLKDTVADAFGLSREDKMELASLYRKRSELEGMVLNSFIDQDLDTTDLDTEIAATNERINQIQSKKKIVNKELLNKYYLILAELSRLDESKSTKYYEDEVDERLAVESAKVDVSNMPKKIFFEGVTYQNISNQWRQIDKDGVKVVDRQVVENAWKKEEGTKNLKTSKWWADNHIIRNRWVKAEEVMGSMAKYVDGSWSEVEDPIYAWRQTRPSNADYIKANQPSLKYKKRIIKEQYRNENYKEDVGGNIRPKITGAKDDSLLNKDYFKLANSTDPTDRATFKMLNFLKDTYLKSQEAVGNQEMRPGYKLPAILKSDVERMFSRSIGETGANLMEKIGRLFSTKIVENERDKDIIFGYTDDTNGNIPMPYLGQIKGEDQSMELPRIIQMFAEATMKREALIQSLPFANAVKDIVNRDENRPVKTKAGRTVSIARKYLKRGTTEAKRQTNSNRALQINEMIKSEFYGEHMKDVPGAKLVNTVLGYGSKLLLGGNFVSAVQNYANAFTQTVIESETKKGNLTLKGYATAQKIYWAHIHEMMSDIGKYGNKSYITQFFDYFGGINFKTFTKDNKSLAHAGVREFVAALSVPNQITEHMLNYQMGIAVALNYRVKAVVDGKETMIPIFNAFTKEGYQLKVKPGVEVTENDRLNMISRLNSSARRINGEYGDKVLVDKYILGRLTLFMNRYVIPFVVKRYGPEKFDIQDGIRDEGYWRLFGKLILKDIKSLSIPLTTGWRYYSTEEKIAIQKASTEFGFTVLFFLMINALGGGDNKKLKQNSILANNLIYALKGIQQQNEAFMPVPGIGLDDLFRKIQNPFPILGKIKNLISLMQDASHTLYYEMGLPGVNKTDVYYTKKTGWHKVGDLKMMNDLEKLLAIPYRIEQYLNPDQAIKNQDAFSRIK